MSDCGPKTHHLDRRAHKLIEDAPPDEDTLLTSNEVASWLGVSRMWVDMTRASGEGPPFLKIGPRYIRYRRSAVVEWLKTRERRVTSEYVKRPSESAGKTRLSASGELSA